MIGESLSKKKVEPNVLEIAEFIANVLASLPTPWFETVDENVFPFFVPRGDGNVWPESRIMRAAILLACAASGTGISGDAENIVITDISLIVVMSRRGDAEVRERAIARLRALSIPKGLEDLLISWMVGEVQLTIPRASASQPSLFHQ
jgi:hypothetical protein